MRSSQINHSIPFFIPYTVVIASLLSKPSRRVVDVEVEYIGSEIPDEFVVGYGLDMDEKYRQMDYIGILKPEVYM